MTASDIAADCAALDSSESISVSLRRPDGVFVIPVAGALRRGLSRQEHPADGVALAGDQTVWHVPHSAIPESLELQPGDQIAAGEGTWTIIAVDRQTLGTRWRCVCRKSSS